jgi:WD40 repeat protein
MTQADPEDTIEREPGDQGSDVFVSYARQDQSFVRLLVQGLAERGKRAWVDWADIPPTAEWMAEIDAAIVSSASVVAVLSPDFCASEVCGTETQHAAEAGKRIIPILRREVEPESVLADLAKRNWVMFRDADDFDQALDQLVSALETDLEHVKLHTRLLGRASEWEARRENASLLLRGADLSEAETWLSSAQAKDPLPTTLHTRYLVASRKASIHRQRRLTVAIAAALVVSLVLGTAAWKERDTAISREHVARSRELAALAVSQLSVDPQRSLQLALEALRSGDTAQAEDALRQSLIDSHVRRILNDPAGPESAGGGVNDAEYSPDGTLIVTAAGDGAARIWDAATGVLLRTLKNDRRAVVSAAFSPNGAHIVTVSKDGMARIWDTSSGRQLHGLHLGGRGRTARYDHSGRRIVTASSNQVQVWNAHTGIRLASFQQPVAHLSSAEFSPDGNQILVAGATNLGMGTVYQIDGATGHRIQSYAQVSSYGPEARYSPDGRLVAATDGTSVAIWAAKTGHSLHSLPGTIPTYGLAFSSDSAYLATGDADGAVSIWSIASGTKVADLLGHTDAVFGLAFAPGDSTLATSSFDGTVRVWSTSPGVPALRFATGGLTFGGSTSPGGQLLVAAAPPRITIAEADTGNIVRMLRGPGDPLAVDVSTDGARLAVVGSPGSNAVYDTSTWMRLFTTEPKGKSAYAVSYSSDGQYLAIAGKDRGIRLLDASSGAFVREMRGHHSPAFSVAFSPDSTILVSASPDGTARIWSVGDGTQQRVLHSGRHTLWARFTPDGNQVITASGGRLAVWNTRTGKQVRVFQGSQDIISSGDIRADDRFLAFGGDDGHLRFLDLSSGAVVEDIATGAANGLSSVTWLPDGRVYATLWDGVGALYACDVCSSLAQQEQLAQQRVVPQPTSAQSG